MNKTGDAQYREHDRVLLDHELEHDRVLQDYELDVVAGGFPGFLSFSTGTSISSVGEALEAMARKQ
jgi:hypothetical protein